MRAKTINGLDSNAFQRGGDPKDTIGVGIGHIERLKIAKRWIINQIISKFAEKHQIGIKDSSNLYDGDIISIGFPTSPIMEFFIEFDPHKNKYTPVYYYKNSYRSHPKDKGAGRMEFDDAYDAFDYILKWINFFRDWGNGDELIYLNEE